MNPMCDKDPKYGLIWEVGEGMNLLLYPQADQKAALLEGWKRCGDKKKWNGLLSWAHIQLPCPSSSPTVVQRVLSYMSWLLFCRDSFCLEF